MFIVVRVRWAATPLADVWSDDLMRAWLNPDIEWSLAHCWSRSSFRHVTLNPYYLSPVVVVSQDPRTNPTYGHLSPRDALTQGVMDSLPPEVIADNAEAIASGRTRFMFCFAQQTDLYGTAGPNGGVPTGHAVCDLLSPFAAICQEVGHAYGFDHELADNTLPDGRYESYGSPYSFMSAMSGAEHVRPVVSDLPKGPPDPKGIEPQRRVGPQLALANLHVKKVGDFPNPETCIFKDYASFEHSPAQVSISSADAAISAWPDTKLPALAVIPHTPADDRAYYIEFRTRDHYDSAITGPAVVMHSYRRDLWDGDGRGDRLVYEGAVVAGSGDTDLKSRSGAIAIKPHFDLSGSRAVIQIGKGDAFAATLGIAEGPDYEATKIGEGTWRSKHSRPCPFDKGRSYNARPAWYRTESRVAVSASGYHSPRFRFFLHGQELGNHLGNTVTVNALVDVIDEPGLDSRQESRSIAIGFEVTGSVLTLKMNEPCNGSVTIGASVEESSNGSARVDRHHLFEFGFRGVGVEWDQSWHDDVKTCLSKRPVDLPEQTFPWEQEGPRPNWQTNIFDIIEVVNETSPAMAQQLVKGLNDKASLDRTTLGKLNARWKPLG